MKNKSRKSKKLFVIIAMVLMIGLVAGMGAMTYSRYVTSGSSGDKSATAAKWGFVVTVDATDLFGQGYVAASEGSLATVTAKDSGVAVKASGDTNVIAPGTTGSMTISISGSAEVLAKLSITSTGTISEICLGDYYPVKWTLKEGTTTIVDAKKLSDVIKELKDTSETFAAGATCNKNYTLSWEWALEVGDTDAAKEVTNAKDTLIGYKAAGKGFNVVKDIYVGSTILNSIVSTEEAYNAIVTSTSFNLTISVEQIQKAS